MGDGATTGPARARRQSKDELEFYPTPAWATRAILRVLRPGLLDLAAPVILDPCCGRGAILDVVRENMPRAMTRGIEINENHREHWSRHEVSCADAMTESWGRADAIVVNPPFSLGQAFVERALDHGSRVSAFLLRLAFLETPGRGAFHRAHPSDIYVLQTRPSFSGDGKSDMAAYAWFVFGCGRGGRWQVLDDADPAKKVRAPRRATKGVP